MAEKIINNPSLLPGDLEIELSGGSIIAISGHPLIGSGGGTQSDYVYYPVFDDTTGNVEFHLGTTASNPQPAGGWHISGATGPQGIQGEQGIQGIQGIPGIDGKNPVFEINSSDAHWRWKYAEATSGWTDLGVVASGAVGPKGQDGTNGVTPGVRINTSTNKWEIADDGVTWVPTDVNATGPAGQNGTNGINGTDGKDGKDGTNGKDGVSPTVSSEQVTGGTEVTFTYGTGQTETITVLDGTPGAAGASGYSPTVSTEAVTAEGHPQGGTKVTITDLEHQSGQEFYVWNGTNGQGATVNLLDGDGIHITNDGTNYTIGVSANYSAMAVTWVQDQHYLSDIPNTYALKTDVEAASANAYNEAVAQIPSVADFITKDVNNLTYYYDKTETSSTSEITNALSTKLDSTVAAQTYQTKADMSNYLTTSDASTTYQPIGNYATTSDISDMATKTWVGQRGYLTQSDLAGYATETYVDTASAAALSQAKTWVKQQNFATTAGLAANTRYEMTNTGWTSAIKIQVDTQVPTTDDGILHIILES